MTAASSQTEEKVPSRARKVIRVAILLIGIATIHMFWFSFIALGTGLTFFALSSDSSWKRHGIVMAFCTGTSTYAAHVLLFRSPLMLAFLFGTIPYVCYLLISVIWSIFLGKQKKLSDLAVRISTVVSNLPRYGRLGMMLLLVLAPVTVWSAFYIDLGVMFDNEPQLLWISAPSMVDVGSEFEITVEAWDAYERLSATYKGTVDFSTESYNLTTYSPLASISADLPEPYTFTGQFFGSDIAYEINDGKDNGLHEFTATVHTPGIHYLLVDDSVTGNTYYSNPIIITNLGAEGSSIYWGDFHTHTEISDGTGTAEHSLYYGRQVACLDYVALTDHGEILMWNPWSVDILENAVNAAYDPNQYVTFHGMEWTDVVTGHFTCIFSGSQQIRDPILSYLHLPRPEDLWSKLDDFTESTGSRALALPHHSTQNSYIQDWTYMNPKYVKVVEVASVHGTFLYEQRHPLNYMGAIDPPPLYLPGSSVIDSLRMGYRMTLYASSDEHDGHPGRSLSHTPAFVGHQRPWSMWHTRNEHPYPGGVTAVYAQALTRESIFSGLENQRIYANSDHGRPFLNFTINGVGVGDGSVLQVADNTMPRRIQVLLLQDGAPAATVHTAASVVPGWTPNWLADVEIIKNGEILTSIPVFGPVANVTFIDSAVVSGASYGIENCVLRDGTYYINEYSDNPIDPSLLNTGGVDFYIIRVVGNNGRFTYAGPIWVEVV